MTTIYLVRHGEAEGNAFRRIHGQYDSMLTPTGFRQVEALARRFREIPVDACFASDLTRTSLTARAVSPEAAPVSGSCLSGNPPGPVGGPAFRLSGAV